MADSFMDVCLCVQELTYKKLPKLYKHLQAQQCEMSIIATDWFLCLFATTLPSEVSLCFVCATLQGRSPSASPALSYRINMEQAESSTCMSKPSHTLCACSDRPLCSVCDSMLVYIVGCTHNVRCELNSSFACNTRLACCLGPYVLSKLVTAAPMELCSADCSASMGCPAE